MADYIYAFTPSENAVEPSKVRVIECSVESLKDPLKVRIKIELTPFTQLPDIRFSILDENNIEVSSVNMIESVLDQLNFVMHLRKPANTVRGNYTLVTEVIYRDIGKVDEKSIQFSIA